jgi:hypothetical protein
MVDKSMKIGIVGSEGVKFTKIGEARARDAIRGLLTTGDTVVSGHCHLGGIDIWAEEVAAEQGLPTLIFPPRELNWNNGYKPRNLQIAHNSDKVVCITIDTLPADYDGMRFPKGCYHCQKAGRPHLDHIKSGGCWTVLQAMKKGKEGQWIVITND